MSALNQLKKIRIIFQDFTNFRNKKDTTRCKNLFESKFVSLLECADPARSTLK